MLYHYIWRFQVTRQNLQQQCYFCTETHSVMTCLAQFARDDNNSKVGGMNGLLFLGITSSSSNNGRSASPSSFVQSSTRGEIFAYLFHLETVKLETGAFARRFLQKCDANHFNSIQFPIKMRFFWQECVYCCTPRSNFL